MFKVAVNSKKKRSSKVVHVTVLEKGEGKIGPLSLRLNRKPGWSQLSCSAAVVLAFVNPHPAKIFSSIVLNVKEKCCSADL